MTNERNDSVLTPGGILFACGTVLGLCLGFAAGHLSVWSRNKPDDRDESWASSWSSPESLAGSSLSTDDRFASEGLDPLGTPLQNPGPFYAAAARRLDPTSSLNRNRQQQAIRVATETSATAAEPEGLAHSTQAAPIDEETRYREEVTRSIISQELPQASNQERDVWFDVLRGLDPADVKGILRMRKNVGGDGRIMAGTPGPFPESARLPAGRLQDSNRPAGDQEWLRTINALRRVRAIRLHNLCHAGTPGYQRLVPVVSDAGEGELGVRLSRVEHLFAPGEFHETGRPLDVAVEGRGFLQVRWNDQTRLTRCGRLRIEEDRHFALAITPTPWRLDPPLVVPEDAGSLTIDSEGRVTAQAVGSTEQTKLGVIPLMTVLDPSGLRYTGDGLYETTPASGPAHRLAAGGTLRQHGVERLPRAVIDNEYEMLEREARLIEDMQPPEGTASITDSWP